MKGSEKHKRSRKSYKGIKEEKKIEKSNQRPVVSQKMRIVQESIGSTGLSVSCSVWSLLL